MNATEVSTPSSSFGYFDPLHTSRERSYAAGEQKNYKYYKLESESSDQDSDGSESVQSVQDKETDLAKDTSDTDWSSENSVAEFEIRSSSDEKAEEMGSQVIEGDGSSDTDIDIYATTVLRIAILETDGDCSSSCSVNTDASFDSEIGRSDYWKCVQCKNDNNNPMFRYCEKCYKVRKDFFPPRPKRKRSKKTKKQNTRTISGTRLPLSIMETVPEESEQLHKNKNDTAELDFKNIVVPTVNSINQKQISDVNLLKSDSNETESYEPLKISNKKRHSDYDSDEISKKRKKDDECNLSVINDKNISKTIDFRHVELGFSKNSPTSFSQPEFNTYVDPISKTHSELFNEKFSKDDLDTVHNVDFLDKINSSEDGQTAKIKLSRQHSGTFESKTCIVCMVEPRTGIFVHGRIAHICCCYKCSVKVWTKTKRCPACNCKVSNVLRAFDI